MADQGVRTLIGVDPATNVVSQIDDARIHVVNNYFNEAVASEIKERFGAADMVLANNVYAHIPDINGATRAVHDLLSEDGVFIFEVHYLGKVIHAWQYDMIYHEHLYYYSLIALKNHFKRFGMVIFDVKPIAIHAGSMRYYVCKRGSKHAQTLSPRVRQLEQEELQKGFDKAETYEKFAAAVAERKDTLMNLLSKLKKSGKSIIGYGASGRANTMIQYCGITNEHLTAIVDDAPAKEGFYTPGSHIQIASRKILDESPPDYVLIFAWGYFNEIAEKCRNYLNRGGKLITPLPEVRIIFHPRDGDDF
jgi:SAM-dependent methyltransferase